jgi:uncharacterized FlaG/YvyC family protein
MRDAAKTGREQQVPEKMSKAAQAAQENQTSTAEEQQQQAMDALEQMVQDMNDAAKNATRPSAETSRTFSSRWTGSSPRRTRRSPP